SVTGIARAVLVDLTGGHVQGGSTITQQYAKNAYLTQRRTLSRKLREAVIAVKLSHQRSHDEVLRDYLNTIYFGRGASGIQNAAIKAEDDRLNSKVTSLTTNDPPVGALVAMQPSDGAIRALYGGQGSANGDCGVRLGGCLNLATQGSFQPGSSFKPYVLATAE